MKKDSKMSTNMEWCRKYVRSQVEKSGRDTAGLALLIELCAGSLMAWRKLQNELSDVDTLTVKEISREGNQKLVIHPLVAETSRAAETYRRQLSELLMTPKAKTSNTRTRKDEKDEKGNPLAQMLDKIARVGDD